MVTIRQKISGAMRTLTGAGYFCNLRSHLAIATNTASTSTTALVHLTSSRPWILVVR